MKPNILQKIQLWTIKLAVFWLNFVLAIFAGIFFLKKRIKPANILIYKIGNIGDIVCAVPAFIAIRRFYPEAKITLLTSPGKKGAFGAKELLTGVWYLNELKIYYGEDIDSFEKKKKFIADLEKQHYDLFIQLPDDLADFRTLLRNMIFAKLLRVKCAFGFKIRTIQLFKKTQVDYLSNKTEVESLLELLKENGIPAGKVEFDFNVSTEQKNKVKDLLVKKWGINAGLTVAFSPGGKRETNQWPVEKFKETAGYLQDKYRAKIIIAGGKADIEKAEIIRKNLKEENVLVLAGKLDLLETFELLKHCSFLVSNSTGTIHLAAAAGISAVGLYGVRDVFGRWFPYGQNHQILHKKFLDCDYRQEECIKKSIDLITAEEAMRACDKLL